MEFDAFISHSSKDKTMADAVCAKLEQAGIRCWIAPRDIQPGMTWSGEIMKAIEKCKVMVLVFSSNANESVQIVREVESAVHRGKPILPLRIEDIQPSDSMAFFMNSVHWLDAISEPHERHLDQLVQAVGSLLGTPITPKPASPQQTVPAKTTPVTTTPASFDWKPICYAVPGVVALVVLAVFFLKSSGKSSGGGGVIPVNNLSVVPAVAPANNAVSAPSANAIDPSMTGLWYLKTTVGNLPAMMTANYDPEGNYKIETVISDSGTYSANAGNWSTISKTGAVQQGTFSYVDPHNIEGTGPAGTAKWTDDFSAAPLDPNNPSLVGTWQTSVFPPNSAPWNMSVTYASDGTYSAKTDIVDQGTFNSANGRMTMSSHTTGIQNVPVTYSPVGQGSMEFTGPLGAATWSRSQP